MKIMDTFKVYHFIDEIDRLFDALGKKEVRWVIQYLYFKGRVKLSDLIKSFKEAYPDSEYPDKELTLFTRTLYVSDENTTYIELSALGKHVYRWSPLLFFPIDAVLDRLILTASYQTK